MNARYVKRKCSVRGCKNTDSYMISLTREMGNSVIICRSCAKEAFAAIGKAEKARPKEKKKTGIPSLFFNDYTHKVEKKLEGGENENKQGADAEDAKTPGADGTDGAIGADGTPNGTKEPDGANATTE